MEHMDRYIMDVADPSSPNFGKHWSAERVAQTFRPAQDTADQTVRWLIESGIALERLGHSQGKNWIQFDATVEEAERLFDTQYHYYKHENGDTQIACDQYGLPGHVKHHVDFVMPTIHLNGMVASKIGRRSLQDHSVSEIPQDLAARAKEDLSNCSQLVTIECVRALYNIPVGKYNHSGNQLGVAEWADYLYLPDLAIYLKNWTNPPIPTDVVPEFISIDGGLVGNLTVALEHHVFEAGYDLQTSISLVYPQGTRQYQIGDGINIDSAGTFNIFLDALDSSYCTSQGGDQPYLDPSYPDANAAGYQGPTQCGGAPMSNVIAVSYGQLEGALPVFYQQRQCYEWGKLALQGTTVIFASGDAGVANAYNANHPTICLNAEYGYVDANGTKFLPSFPQNCPYITTTGGTQLLGSIEEGEVVAPFSGGGFSDIFAAPPWQNAAVSGYLNANDPGYGPEVFNRSGRGFPDMATISTNVAVVYLNRTLAISGTSAGPPIFGSMITLLNEERLHAGKPPIGFLNPLMYAHPEMFNDITDGSNPGCGTDGFQAARGWDPVTGLGTPDYEKFRRVLLAV
ncbi:subtilisin-like protein [Thozetella sp. PMI_491]|nr:subtilisin-like protein [Thozetella sp. PMI_491]